MADFKFIDKLPRGALVFLLALLVMFFVALLVA